MNIEQLHYFLAVAKHLNFTEAAKEFYISQPAISHQISELEQELGTKLFHRSTRIVSLTPSGKIFLEDAKRFLDLLDNTRQRIHLVDNSTQYELKISYLASPCKTFLPELVYRFRQQYPQVKVSLASDIAYGISKSMKQDSFDLYFSLNRDFELHEEYAHRPIFTDYFCLLCRNDHMCLTGAQIDYDKINNEPFLMFDPEKAPFMVKQIMQICKTLQIKPKIVQYFSTMDEILFATEAGLGISILPYKTRNYISAALAYVPLPIPSINSTLAVAWKENTANVAVSWFLDMLTRFQNERPELF